MKFAKSSTPEVVVRKTRRRNADAKPGAVRRVAPGAVDGEVRLPPSKSMTLRAIALAALARGESCVLNPANCEDAQAALRLAQDIGADAVVEPGQLLITGGGAPRRATLDCGESGLCLRMFAPIAALQPGKTTLTGRGSLLRRPTGDLEQPLQALGARARTTAGLLPIVVHGPLGGGKATVDGSLSSQFLTGLLIALPLSPRDSDLTVARLASKPYVAMTLAMARAFGAAIECDEAYTRFRVTGRQTYRAARPVIEEDWSAAAFMLAAGALAGRVCAPGLAADSLQADARIVEALQAAGARLETADSRFVVEQGELHGFAFDITDCPDLAPSLAALAVHCRGTTVIAGARRLVHKESNRAEALCAEFGKLGADVRFDGERLTIVGGPLTGGEVDAHGDHRIAMALAVAALRGAGPVTIRGADSVAKSYPRFFEDLARLKGGAA